MMRITDSDYQAALHHWCLSPSWAQVKAKAKRLAAQREQRELLDKMREAAESGVGKRGDELRRCISEHDRLDARFTALQSTAWGGTDGE